MDRRAARRLTGLVLAAVAAAANGAVEVRFVDAGQFTDATLQGYGEPPAANPVLTRIRAHLLELGERCIAPEQSLLLRVLEIDLAGHYDWRYRESWGNFRLLPNVAWTRMTIEYVWHGADGAPLASGIDRLRAADYVDSRIRPRFSDAPLPDERQMLERWFRARFCAGPGGGATAPAGR